MNEFKAFADTAQETTIIGSTGQIVVSSDDDNIIIAGDLEIRSDELGLAAALKMRDLLNEVIDAISARKSQDPTNADPLPTMKQKNPFD